MLKRIKNDHSRDWRGLTLTPRGKGDFRRQTLTSTDVRF